MIALQASNCFCSFERACQLVFDKTYEDIFMVPVTFCVWMLWLSLQMTYILRRFPDASSCLLLGLGSLREVADASSCLLLYVMKTCTAILVSVELQAPSFFSLGRCLCSRGL